MDRGCRARETETERPLDNEKTDEGGSVSDIFRIARIKAFWYIPFSGTSLFGRVPFPGVRYELMRSRSPMSRPSSPPARSRRMLPFGNVLLTPLFGSIYDRKGRRATIMLIGSALLVIVHVLFSIPMLTSSWIAVVLIVLLGAAFSLVPSAMWPSVPKIIPYRMLGTSYSMIFWIQNWGLSFVPMLIGYVLDRYCVSGTMLIDGIESTSYDYTLPMMIFAGFGVLSIVFALLLRREDRIKGYGLERPNIEERSAS